MAENTVSTSIVDNSNNNGSLKKDGESNVSRFLQLIKYEAYKNTEIVEASNINEENVKAYSEDFDGDGIVDETTYIRETIPENLTFTALFNENINITETEDYQIIKRLLRDSLEKKIPVITRDKTFGNYIVTTESIKERLDEPFPTGYKGFYDKIYIPYEKDGFVFLFDRTDGNNRIHLKHPSHSYFTIDNTGNWITKVKGDEVTFTEGTKKEVIYQSQHLIIKGFDVKTNEVTDNFTGRFVEIQGYDSLTVHNDMRYQTLSNFVLETGKSFFQKIKADRSSYINGTDLLEAKNVMYKTTDEIGFVSGKRMIFSSPEIIFKTSGTVTMNYGVFNERSDAREISATGISIQATNNLILSTGIGTLSISSGKKIEETIIGIPGMDSRTTNVSAGNYTIKTTLGNINLNTIIGNIELSTPLASVKVNVTGEISIKNAIGELGISAIGAIKFKNAIGGIESNVAGITEIKGTQIKMGAGTEPFLKANATVDWLKNHTHPTPNGNSGVALESAGLLQLKSVKIFGE